MRLLLLTFFLSAFSFFTSFSQTSSRPCGTDEQVRKSLTLHPELRIAREELEEFTRHFTPSNDRDIKVIPIVFHIIHNYGPENIPKEQVEDAVRILNLDYQLLNTDQSSVISAFSGIVANVGFEFRLARIDPNGNCTDGITRTVSTLTYSGDDNVKQLISWPRNKYLNVWVVDQISFGAGGYAYLPGSSPSATDDGIVVINTQLGTVGTSNGSNFSARTLTHEVGHWFNLLHTWGDTNSPGVSTNCNTDDNVADTPNTIGVANQSCNLAQSTCGLLDNVQNYMDYSSCAIMFTNGQKNRMIAAINSQTSGRNNLWSATNLNATGVSSTSITPCAPIADFTASATSVCSNTNITFNDLSYNSDVDGTWNWNWNFPGGTPSSSNLQNPIVSYAVPGSYTATLTVGNSTGNDTKTRSSYINVNTSTPSLVSPVVEGFEVAAFPQNDPDATRNWRYDLQTTGAFARTTAVSASGSACLKYNNLQIGEGTVSSVISPVINFSSVTSPTSITFKVAYARRSSSSNDRLELWISSDCGKTWSRRYAKAGATLATTTTLSTSAYTPSASEWRTETVSVTPLAGQAHGMIKFAVVDSSGNNLYLDDVNIVNVPAGISDPSIDEYLTQVFPNPGSGDAQVSYGLFKNEEVNIQILDLAGRMIGQRSFGKQSIGEYKIWLHDLTGGASLAAGAYVIRIEAGNQSALRKWICN